MILNYGYRLEILDLTPSYYMQRRMTAAEAMIELKVR